MEQNLLLFLFSAVMISLSGVISPGPMTAAAIQQGGRAKLTGMYIAFGHGIVEMPLIVFIFLGAGSVFQMEEVRVSIGIVGGIYLIHMGKELIKVKVNEETIRNSKATPSLYSGIFLSVANPYFLLWWATVGAGLVLSAARFGLPGLILFAIFHWLCDLVWYSFLSIASFRGIKLFGAGLYKKVSMFCGFAMFFYGGLFIVNALSRLIY